MRESGPYSKNASGVSTPTALETVYGVQNSVQTDLYLSPTITVVIDGIRTVQALIDTGAPRTALHNRRVTPY